MSEVSPEQFWKAESPMVVTELPMAREVSPKHFLKAQMPMDVTESGTVTEVRLTQLEKA